MDTSLIILELLSRIKVLEEKVKALEEKDLSCGNSGAKVQEKPAFPKDKVRGKYRALAEFLYEKWEKRITLSYEEIEGILDFKLPPTAYNIPRSYWANTLTHPYAASWIEVGYKAKVDIEAQRVTFERSSY